MSSKYTEFIKLSGSLTDKTKSITNFIRYGINKLESMFLYTGLPDTIPAKWLEYYLMTNGNAFITKHDDKLYCYVGGLGGEPDVYFQPTIYTVSNPAQNFSKSFKIDEEGVLIRNDSIMNGMLPILEKYGALLTESDLSIRSAFINTRMYATISAPDDNSKKSAEQYLTKVENGETGIIGDSPFFDGVKMLNQNTSQRLTDLIELTQYVKASFYNEIGLNAAYNLKREYISDTENLLADDILLPLCDNMLSERKEGAEKVNAMYGTEITVDFNSSWKSNATENMKEIRNNIEGGTNVTE